MPDQSGSETPDVSVVMAVHDGAAYLEPALRSIMGQTLTAIEIIVVDDASTDATPEILSRLAAEDSRIQVITSKTNRKLAGALNLGLDAARAPLIARMDDDDIAMPERLEIQKAFLDANTHVTLAGTSIEWIDSGGKTLRRSVRSRDTVAVRWAVRFFLQISHPTMMFRPTLPDGTAIRYDADVPISQDHDLVARILMAGGSVVCLPSVLLQYRTHDAAASRTRFDDQMAEAKRVGTRLQEHDLPEDLVADLAPLRELYFDRAEATGARCADAMRGGRAMLIHDAAQHPLRKAWLRRQTAQLLAWSMRRGGAGVFRIGWSFARHAPWLIPSLAFRALEVSGWLPAAFDTAPSPGRFTSGRPLGRNGAQDPGPIRLPL